MFTSRTSKTVPGMALVLLLYFFFSLALGFFLSGLQDLGDAFVDDPALVVGVEGDLRDGCEVRQKNGQSECSIPVVRTTDNKSNQKSLVEDVSYTYNQMKSPSSSN